MKSTIPRVPHLPGSRLGNDDLVVPPEHLGFFLEAPVVVVEKLDGIALTIGDDGFGQLDVALKTDWKVALEGRIHRAARRWLRVHEDLLEPLLSSGTVIYAEWLLHRLATYYDRLPAAVIFHGIRGKDGLLLPRDEVNEKLSRLGFVVLKPHFRGRIGKKSLASLVPKRAHFGSEPAEGIIVERVGANGAKWAKWVAPHYRQPKGKEISGEENRILEAL
jgi:hypothetical protein